MASNLDYLDPALLPLEDKVNAYLESEKALQRANAALKSVAAHPQGNPPAAAQIGQRSPAGSNSQHADELGQQLVKLRGELTQLEQEIIGMLPTRDEWLKVNLGYGPSRVGAWHVPATNDVPEHYELRIVH